MKRRWPRRLATTAAALLVLGLLGTFAAGWYFSSQVVDPNHDPGPFEDEVVRVAPDTVTLKSSDDTKRPGVYGLDWPGGHAIAGRVLREGDGEVTRELRERRGPLERDTKVEVNVNTYDGDPKTALGVGFREVRVPTGLGPMPAWHVPGRGETWALFVHGYNSSRVEGLRNVRTLRRLRVPTLLITYRNDVGAPKAPGGKIHLGATEWLDLQSAVRFAHGRGARRIVLIGDSMGGAIVSNFVRRSKLSQHVRGLVLDSPALSWKPILSLQAGERHVPFFILDTAEWLIERRIDISWDELDQLDHTSAFKTPILLWHGTDDATVPISTSDEFSRELPRLVDYERVRDATHVGSWNTDPAAYERRLARFLRGIGAVPSP